MRLLKSLYNFLLQKSSLCIFLIFISIIIVLPLLFGIIVYLFHLKSDHSWSDNVYKNLFAVTIFAPIVETFIFQSLIVRVLSYYKIRIRFVILISALCFGVAHLTNGFSDAIFTFFLGLLFATEYMLLYKKGSYPYIATAITHSIYNAIPLLANVILETYYTAS